jgi:hypothetical protein
MEGLRTWRPNLKSVEQAGDHQRGFATTRGAQNREKPGRGQTIDHVVDAVLAPKKQIGRLSEKRA